MVLSHHPTFCGLKNEKYLSGFDVRALVEPLRPMRISSLPASIKRVNDKKAFVRGSFACCVCPGPTCTQPVMSPSVAWLKLTGAGLCCWALTAASICQSPCGYCCSTGRQTARPCGGTDPLRQQVIISN